jgi:hypothetical protein
MGSLRPDPRALYGQPQPRQQSWRPVQIRCAKGWAACPSPSSQNRGRATCRKLVLHNALHPRTFGIVLGSVGPVVAVKAGPDQTQPRRTEHSSKVYGVPH